MDPETAAKACAEMDVKIYSVGIGNDFLGSWLVLGVTESKDGIEDESKEREP